MGGFWVPPSLRGRVLDSVHLSPLYNHPGSGKMLKLLKQMYQWKGMSQDVSTYISSCLTCQRNRPRFTSLEQHSRMHPMVAPNHMLYMDVWGPVSYNDESFQLLTMMDHFTKWPKAVLIPNSQSHTIAKAFFTNWVCRMGAPKFLITDDTRNFIAPALAKTCEMIGTRHLRTTIYHPEGNAPVERYHQSLKSAFRQMRTSAPACTDL